MLIKKIVRALILINILQLLMGIIMWITIVIYGANVNNVYEFLTVGLILLTNIITFIALYLANRYKNNSLVATIHNLEELNTTLRAQRHDYLNHFQVIYGLMELKEYEEAKRYLEPVFHDIMKVSKALKTAQPAVNALLQVKMQEAENKHIDFYLEVHSDLKEIPIEPWNLCKVLANIIDNSITCLGEVDHSKKIHVYISEDGHVYEIQITNNGPQIPEKHLQDIFKQGFTTKKEHGHGMGLFIASKIMEDAKGIINVTSNQEKTCFTIRFPKVI